MCSFLLDVFACWCYNWDLQVMGLSGRQVLFSTSSRASCLEDTPPPPLRAYTASPPSSSQRGQLPQHDSRHGDPCQLVPSSCRGRLALWPANISLQLDTLCTHGSTVVSCVHEGRMQALSTRRLSTSHAVINVLITLAESIAAAG